MNHLKHINELLKSTYMSAARGLDASHPRRAEEIRKWASDKGEADKVDRIYPHKFHFKNESIPEHLSKVLFDNEYFFISEIERKTAGIIQEYASIHVTFKSNYGTIIVLVLSFNFLKTTDKNPGEWSRIKLLKFNKFEPDISYVFLSRKEAYEFKKCVMEWVSDNEKEHGEVITKVLKSISLNKFYISK